MRTVQTGVLVGDTGESARTIQHWSDIGILRPEASTDKRGRGNYRTYRADPLGGERTWALLASALFKLRMPLGDIRHIIHAERLWHDPIELLDKNAPYFEQVLRIRADRKGEAHPFEDAIRGVPGILTAMAMCANDEKTPFHEIHLTGKWPEKEYGLLSEFMAKHSSAVILNLSEIFKPLREGCA